jgi:Arc/MetJ family transcription regulator
MRVTLTVDDALMARAQALTGAKHPSELLQRALQALIEQESARRLALLGGTEPELVSPPRRG